MLHFNELYSKLNDGQRQAVDHIDGPMMVLAGAGTGKTQVIAMRIANLLRNGVEAHAILCLTFTESGVAAMRERLVRILGSQGYFVRVHTFHSFCNEVIQEHPERFVFAKELVPLADLEKMQLMGELLDTQDVSHPLKTYGDPYFYRNAILSTISTLKRERVAVERLAEMVSGNQQFLAEIEDVLREFAASDARQVHAEVIARYKSQIAHSLQKARSKSEDVLYLYKSLLTVIEQAFVEAEMNPGKSGKVSYKGVRDAVKRFYESLTKYGVKQESLVGLYRAYQDELVKRGRYDFDDMILFVLRELERDPILRAEYLERYQYILIDEYQDTNASQNSLARMFGEGIDKPNIFVVGDDDQAIYRFQGANLENVLSFYHYYSPHIALVTLVNNYRSHQRILDASGNVIGHNIFRAQVHLPDISKELRAARGGEGEALKYVAFDRYEDELVWLGQEILRLEANGVELSEIAILTRTNAQSDEVARYLQKANIAYVLERGENVFDVIEVRQFLQLLRVIQTPYDNHALFYLLHSAFLKISINDVMRLHLGIESERREDRTKRSLIDAMQDEAFMQSVGVQEGEALKRFALQILSWREMIYNEAVIPTAEKIFVNSGMMSFVEHKADSLVSLSAFKALLDYVCEYVGVHRNATLEELLGYLDDHELHNVPITYHVTGGVGQGVRLMTVHKSKGLEFDYVFMPQCTDHLWGEQVSRDKLKLPMQMISYDLSVLSKEALEDERRLFYVALTRGKKDVILSFAQHDQKGKEQMPSRFIEEIGLEHLESINRREFRAPTLTIDTAHNPAARIAEDILRTRLSELRLSATNINDYLHCPRLFFYKHFIRAPIMRSKYMALGTATHEAIEALYRSVAKTDSPVLAKEEMLALFERVLWREMFDVKDFRDSLQRGKEFLSAYYDFYADNLISPLFIEYDFGRDNVYLGEIPLTGKVDMIELVDPLTRRVVFYDFKTGKPERKLSELKVGGEIWRQIVIYKLLSQLSKKFSAQYVMVAGCIDFVEQSKEGTFVRKSVETDDESLDLVQQEIQQVWADVHALSFRCRNERGSCEYCEEVLREVQD